ncbi:DNA double-strand break repair nuclease NurA [Tissierella creatinini]|nr:DNA double-strand break repair nuclease NurA [Tissierella creatinini]TJX64539.1 DNA double-strand break repair nuclease NurA [Soehngenia saccharolytica]
MYNLNSELKTKISQINQLLSLKYERVFSKDRQKIRDFIEKNVGQIKRMEKLDQEKLHQIHEKGGIVGVDGSNNRIGGGYPHYIELFQGLAKSTAKKDEPIYKTHIYTPLVSEEKENLLEEGDRIIEEKKDKMLANIELEAALESISLKPHGIIMDGGLIRYNIYAGDKWQDLRGICEDKDITLFGVIKDIKTSIIGDKLMEGDANIKEILYDRELLFGVLDYGEMILIRDDANRKEPQGYASVFLRSSLQPSVIGMDIIDSQSDRLEDMANLVFTLTPENSRGVPLWLDIVDKEVKISDDIMKSLFETYMDRGIYERFFVSERVKR